MCIRRIDEFRNLFQFCIYTLTQVIQTGPYGAFHPNRKKHIPIHTLIISYSLIILPAYVRHPSYTAIIILCIGQIYSIFVYGPLIGAGARSLAWNLVTAFLVVPAVSILNIKQGKRSAHQCLSPFSIPFSGTYHNADTG